MTQRPIITLIISNPSSHGHLLSNLVVGIISSLTPMYFLTKLSQLIPVCWCWSGSGHVYDFITLRRNPANCPDYVRILMTETDKYLYNARYQDREDCDPCKHDCCHISLSLTSPSLFLGLTNAEKKENDRIPRP